MSRAPKVLTVVMANTYRTEVSIVHENDHHPYIRRTVQIELTEEQRAQLEPQLLAPERHEEILDCWLEPVESEEA